MEVSSSNGLQVSPSASSTVDNIEGATNETPPEVSDSDVNIVQCHVDSRLYRLVSLLV